jgi:hypothetical protein
MTLFNLTGTSSAINPPVNRLMGAQSHQEIQRCHPVSQQFEEQPEHERDGSRPGTVWNEDDDTATINIGFSQRLDHQCADFVV